MPVPFSVEPAETVHRRGVLVALTFVSAVDAPERFRSSRAVGLLPLDRLALSNPTSSRLEAEFWHSRRRFSNGGAAKCLRSSYIRDVSGRYGAQGDPAKIGENRFGRRSPTVVIHRPRERDQRRSGGPVRLVFIRFDGNSPGTAIAIEVGRSIQLDAYPVRCQTRPLQYPSVKSRRP